MTALLIIGLLLSVTLNGFLIWYAYRAARQLMDVSEKISIFWAELIEYKDFLESLLDMHSYTDDGTVKSFVESTKQMLKEVSDFREFCELADLLTEEEMQILEEMEEDYEDQKEAVMKEQEPDEHVQEWDRAKIPSKTQGIQSR